MGASQDECRDDELSKGTRMKKPNWVEMNKALAFLSEEQVFILLQTEIESYCRPSYLNRLHQRYCALRDARERKEILSKAEEVKQKFLYSKEEVALIKKKAVLTRRKNEDRRENEEK